VGAESEAEFRAFVAARQVALLRTAYLLTGDRGIAEDLLQTALTKTYLAWGRIRDKGAAEAYARAALVTTSTSWWRRHWHGERPTERLPDRATDADATAALDDRDAMWTALSRLPARQRAVIVLRYYEDLTEDEIARALGCSRGTVKSQASRALRALRGYVDAPGRTEEASA
jgi:RNA polymerase sigma-70 factor (sigma-E family)